MKTQPTDSSRASFILRSEKNAGARIIVLVMAAFILGLVCGGYFYYRHVKSETSSVSEPAAVFALSDSTRAILQRLDSPVDIQFYSPANPATLPETLSAFTARVQLLVSEYERVGDGKIRLGRSDPALKASAKTAAGADGVLPFSGNNGEICYLGITVAQNGRKVTIAQLSPEWEAALEADLTRAIARVAASAATPAAPAAQVSTSPAPIDPAISEELLRTIPDLESRSFDDAAKILRESALAEFTVAAGEMQTKVQETQKQLAAVQGNQSEADQQAARKQLQQVQNEETKKLADITARLQARIKVLERLKGVNRPPPK